MYTFDERIVSDLHKDAFGYRPLQYFWAEWDAATDAAKQEIWDDLLDALQRAVEFERVQQEAAVADYHSEIANMMTLGAQNEYQARKWIVQGLGLNQFDLSYGGEHVCFHLNLPYTMKKMFDQICRELRQEMNN